MDENVQSPANAPAAASGDTQDRKSGKKKWILLLLLLLLLAAGTVFALFHFGVLGSSGNPDGILIGAGIKQGEIDPETGDAVTDDETAPGANGKSNMTVRLNSHPVFEDGAGEGNLNIVNPAVNLLYMTVEITLDDTGETIYESGAIPPDHYIDNDKLAKVLEPGEYEATAHVTLIDPDNPDRAYNGADFSLTLTVNN